MFYQSLFERILVEPAKKFSKLKIVSGYGSAAMGYNHRQYLDTLELNPSIELVLGMTLKDGLGQATHNAFIDLSKRPEKKFSCSYLVKGQPIHAKTYIWYDNDTPALAFVGSGNYSQNAFFDKTIETFTEADPKLCNSFFIQSRMNSLGCLDNSVLNNLKIYDEFKLERKKNLDRTVLQSLEMNCVILSLLGKNKLVQSRSGLNWGQRPKRESNQAYIPVTAEIARSNFFPSRTRKFTLTTDDGFSMNCVIAQDGDKAIQTTENNSILGRYFRSRLGLRLGEPIRIDDLIRYGRTDVKICRLDLESYFLDFSV